MAKRRRTFLGSLLASSLAAFGVSNSLAQSGKPHVAVIGAGAFGGWTALSLLRSGAKVTLLDAWGPGNSRSSSGGSRASFDTPTTRLSMSTATGRRDICVGEIRGLIGLFAAEAAPAFLISIERSLRINHPAVVPSG